MLKSTIKSAIKRIIRPSVIQNTGDPYDIFKAHCDNNAPLTIFDCGAHIGVTALKAAETFPGATVYAFEAAPKTFEALQQNTAENGRIIPVHAAIGVKSEKQGITINVVENQGGIATDNHIATEGRDYSHIKNTKAFQVDGIRLDDFCAEKGISYIDYLKIDIEGHEMQALESAIPLLEKKAIRFIELELGISSKNQFHTPYLEAWQFLTQYDYDVMGFFAMVPDFVRKEPFIRRANVLFMARS